MSGFATDISAEECWKNKAVVTLAFGHTHFSWDFTDELGKNVIANQKGYAEATEKAFDMKKTFMLGRDTKLGVTRQQTS